MINLTSDNFKRRFPDIGLALEPDELTALLDLFDVQYVEAAESLIIAGTITDALYFVWDGELDVLMRDDNHEYKVATIEEGELLGEISLLSPGPATATVRSEAGCVALHLDVDSLEQFWIAHPHAASVFLRAINKLVTKRILHADEILRSVTHARDTNTLKQAQNALLQGKLN